MLNPLNWKDIYLIPNLISLSRILLLPVFVYYIINDNATWSIIIFGLIVLSDFLDGLLSRSLKQVTKLGKILDPLADKIAIAVIASILYLYKGFPLWYLLALIARDSIIFIGGAYFYNKKKIITTASTWGKLTTTVLAILVCCYILNIKILINPTLYLSIVLFLLSSLIYAYNFVKQLKN